MHGKKLLLLIAVALAGCDRISEPDRVATGANWKPNPNVSTGLGSARRGKALVTTYGCISCHTIPGVSGADGTVGPPLQKMAYRSFVAGVMKNTPENLVTWIQNPPGVDPMTGMPNLNVTPGDAKDLAAFLYTLR